MTGSRCWQRFLLLAAALVAASWLGLAHAEPDRLRGLVPPVAARKSFKIGVTLVHLDDDFWKGIAYGIVDEARRSNVQVVQISVAGGYGNTREQFAQLTALKTLGVNYVALGAASFNGYDPVIRELRLAGIKVIAAGIPVNSAEVAFGVAQDDFAIGNVLADAVCARDRRGRVVMILGPPGAEWARLRYLGFVAGAKRCGGLTLYDGAFRGSLDLQDGLSQTSDLLLKHPDANFVYTPQISLGMGAVQAARQMRRSAPVVSSAMVKEAVPMILGGRFLAVVSEPGILIGRLIVQYAIRDREGKPMPNLGRSPGSSYPTLIVPPKLITPQNATSFPLNVYEIPPSNVTIGTLR